MNKKIVVHIGTYKTGTSSIQYAMAQSRDKLKQQKIHYLETGLHPTLDKHLGFYNLGYLSQDGKNRGAMWQGVDIEGLARQEIAESKCSTFIISEEELSVPDPIIPQKLSFLKELGQVQVVLCVRRQDKFLESLYLQFMKEPGRRLRKTFGDFLNDPEIVKRAEFDRIADLWSDIYGRDNITVLDFEVVKAENKLVKNFSQLFGVNATFEFPDVRRNTTISHEMAEIIRRFSIVYPKMRRANLTRALNQLDIAPAKEKYVPEPMAGILPRYQNSNARLKERYGVDLLKYSSAVETIPHAERLARNYRFEKRMNRIFMQMVKKAHKEQSWDFIE
ncbi:hypothetical protein [Cohaesibacter marisflavi]|uniref:hypothetical protein n=1 Tax=Cohaesibacter marisflavi TaxID=655353 RepID=UPI0029C7139B|nr:hypothetical protein [Cohaesibacter marisflavi]